MTEQQTTNQEFGRGERVPLWSIHYHVLPLSQKDTNRKISPLFLKVYSSRVTLIPIDSKPDFIIKFEQEMLQGKSIMQMPEQGEKKRWILQNCIQPSLISRTIGSPRLKSGDLTVAEADHWCPAVCPALMGGVIIRDYHCNNYSEIGDTIVFGTYLSNPCVHSHLLLSCILLPAWNSKDSWWQSPPWYCSCADEHLSVTSICFLKHWLWHFFRHNTREVTPERQNIIAFLRECFASVTCLSETISFGGSDESHIILEL